MNITADDLNAKFHSLNLKIDNLSPQPIDLSWEYASTHTGETYSTTNNSINHTVLKQNNDLINIKSIETLKGDSVKLSFNVLGLDSDTESLYIGFQDVAVAVPPSKGGEFPFLDFAIRIQGLSQVEGFSNNDTSRTAFGVIPNHNDGDHYMIELTSTEVIYYKNNLEKTRETIIGGINLNTDYSVGVLIKPGAFGNPSNVEIVNIKFE